MLLDTNYKIVNYSMVINLPDFYKSKLPEIIKVKSLLDACKIVFKLPGNRITLETSEADRIYRVTLQSPGVRADVIGQLYYLPIQGRLDLYLPDNVDIPFIQWKNKKPVFKNYSSLLDLAELDKLFSRIINVI